jgi:chaperone required for assembly of F1-ATPase
MSWKPRRKFWEEVTVAPEAEGFTVRLDAKSLRTPAQAPLVVPTEPLAEAIADEWRAIEAKIDPERLPFTKAANTAIDRVARERAAVIDTIAAYGDADLLCYRAVEPEELRARQDALWEPWLGWSKAVLGAPLEPVAGVMHRAQAPESLAALRAEVARYDALGLTALHDLVTLSGSLVLGLAVARRDLAAEEAWDIARLDENWQIEQWGADEDAEQLAAARRASFLRAESILNLLGSARFLPNSR